MKLDPTYAELEEVLAAARKTVLAWTNAEDVMDVATALGNLSRVIDRLDAKVTV